MEDQKITISMTEYKVLVKKAHMIDMAILAKDAAYGKDTILDIAKRMNEEGWLEC